MAGGGAGLAEAARRGLAGVFAQESAGPRGTTRTRRRCVDGLVRSPSLPQPPSLVTPVFWRSVLRATWGRAPYSLHKVVQPAASQ